MGAEYTESQKRAIDEYRQKNKARTNYLAKRSTAKNFILKHANREDLNDVTKWVKTRIGEIK